MAQLVANNIAMLDQAIPPVFTPSSPAKQLNLVLGILIGLFLGIATRSSWTTSTIPSIFRRTSSDLQLNTLAIVPRFSHPSHPVPPSQGGLPDTPHRADLPQQEPRAEGRAVDEHGAAGRKIFDDGPAGTRAGQRRRPVLLIDCDLRRPTQHLHLDGARDNGLTDFLAAPQPFMNWSYLVSPPGARTCMSSPAGRSRRIRPELLGSDRFKRSSRKPVKPTTGSSSIRRPPRRCRDATLLAGLADIVLLVVRHNHDRSRPRWRGSVSRLRNVNAALVGVILNDVDVRKSKGDDYSGYYLDDPTDGRKGEVGRSGTRASTGTGA